MLCHSDPSPLPVGLAEAFLAMVPHGSFPVTQSFTAPISVLWAKLSLVPRNPSCYSWCWEWSERAHGAFWSCCPWADALMSVTGGRRNRNDSAVLTWTGWCGIAIEAAAQAAGIYCVFESTRQWQTTELVAVARNNRSFEKRQGLRMIN